MPNVQKAAELAPAGSSGNNTHVQCGIPAHAGALGVEFEITAVGGTPTITWKIQGSNDGMDVAATDSDWFDLIRLPADSATEEVNSTKTAVGVFTSYIEAARRFAKKVRLVTSANTNVTYNAELYSGEFPG